MKQVFYVVAIAVLSVTLLSGLSACRKVVGGGPVVSNERTLPDFDRIESSIPGNVYLKEGNEQSVILEGPQEYVDVVETKVQNGILKIKIRNNTNLLHSGRLRVHITIPEYRSVISMGSGNIYGESTINGTGIELKLTGSGNMELDKISSERVRCELTGSGNLKILGGSADDLNIRLTGSGNFNAQHMESNTADVSASGSGNTTLRVRDRLTVNLSGSGDVNYYGNPAVNSYISGSGKVKKKG